MSIPHSSAPAQAPASSFPDPIPGIIRAGSVNILAGASGVGKTCLLGTLLAGLQKGQQVFGRPVNRPPAIGYICADRGSSDAREWLTDAGVTDVRFYALAEDPTFSTIRLRNKLQLVPTLEDQVRRLELPPGALLVVDPITLFLGNPNDYHMCAVACLDIRQMVRRLQLSTAIGTAHASKQLADKKAQYKRLQDRILGSAAQLGYADTQMYLASPEETNEKHYTFLWHPHREPPEVFTLGRTKNGLFVDYALGVQGETEGKILAAVTEGEEGTGFAEIIIATEASKATVHRYLQELLKDGRLLKVGHGKYRKAPAN